MRLILVRRSFRVTNPEVLAAVCDPCGVDADFSTASRGYRSAQPPATIWQASGLPLGFKIRAKGEGRVSEEPKSGLGLVTASSAGSPSCGVLSGSGAARLRCTFMVRRAFRVHQPGGLAAVCDPCGVDAEFSTAFRGYRSAQPPATIWQASGLPLGSTKTFLKITVPLVAPRALDIPDGRGLLLRVQIAGFLNCPQKTPAKINCCEVPDSPNE